MVYFSQLIKFDILNFLRNYRDDFNYQFFILYKTSKKKIDVFYFQINE